MGSGRSETIALVLPIRYVGCLDQNTDNNKGERWSNTGYWLKIEPIGFIDRLIVPCEGKYNL